MFQHRLVVRYTQLLSSGLRRHIYPSEHQPICIRPFSSRQSSRYEIAFHKTEVVSFSCPLHPWSQDHKCGIADAGRLLRHSYEEGIVWTSSSGLSEGRQNYQHQRRDPQSNHQARGGIGPNNRTGTGWPGTAYFEKLLSLTTATIQLQQLHRSLHSNVPTPPRSSLHTTLSSGLPPSHLSQRTPTNLHTPKFSSRQSSRLRSHFHKFDSP
ncbi:unnamed protein product [Acanthosepion pharaonis]|uniref:Uncharacterized protein n=1 Tax=Acanthosepion pharaonis TaxID=158019 RepID=A0A812BMV8_ACAPH|nr:unnamed protein product [Sepia pharaonis]